MKYAKMIGLAALAAMALMAVVASSASASAKVCSTTGTGAACGAGHGKAYTGTVKASLAAGKSAVLQATVGASTTVTCTQSEAEGTVNGETGTGSITKLSFGTCSSPACFGTTTAVSTGTPWVATATTTIKNTNNGDGIMDVTDPGGKFSCTFPAITCSYTAEEHPAGGGVRRATIHLSGSDTAPHMTATNVALDWVGAGLGEPTAVCGHTGDWSGTYRVTTPASLWAE